MDLGVTNAPLLSAASTVRQQDTSFWHLRALLGLEDTGRKRQTCLRYLQAGGSSECAGMNRSDMRSLASDARHARRVEVMGLRSAGLTCTQIAYQTGLSRTGVFDICKRFDAFGQVALRDKSNGIKAGHGRLLLPAQESLVCTLIAPQAPDPLNLPTPLWTPADVAQLIVARLGIRVQRCAMRLYLARWGCARHACMKRAMAHTTPALPRLECDLSAIEVLARLEGAEVH